MENLELVRENITSVMTPSKDIDARYHHNSSYSKAITICRHGIMTISDLNKHGIRHDSPEQLKKWSDLESHANGIDAVSLAVTDSTDNYEDEEVYNPTSPLSVDFRVSSGIDAGRHSIHYANEYLCHRSIRKEELRAVDIRLLKLIRLVMTGDRQTTVFNKIDADKVIEKYNYLIEVAKEMEKEGLGIPLRELSEDGKIYSLDINELAKKAKM